MKHWMLAVITLISLGLVLCSCGRPSPNLPEHVGQVHR